MYNHPVLTDAGGRFALTGLSGLTEIMVPAAGGFLELFTSFGPEVVQFTKGSIVPDDVTFANSSRSRRASSATWGG